MSTSASFTASQRSGVATTFSGSFWSGRYLTFSCFSLITSVSFLPSSSVSSLHHIKIFASKSFGSCRTFSAMCPALQIVETRRSNPVKRWKKTDLHGTTPVTRSDQRDSLLRGSHCRRKEILQSINEMSTENLMLGSMVLANFFSQQLHFSLRLLRTPFTSPTKNKNNKHRSAKENYHHSSFKIISCSSSRSHLQRRRNVTSMVHDHSRTARERNWLKVKPRKTNVYRIIPTRRT